MAQSKRDQLQAYRFMQRRVRTAMLDADPDTSDAPLARMGVATYAGIIIAILVLAGAGIYGIIRPGGSSAWKQTGALIVERETSTRYVYLDNVLYQVANFSSAKLLLGDRLTVVSVSRSSLSSARHGGSIGIPGAPDYVPDSARVAAAAWSVCVAGDLSATSTAAMQFQPGVTAPGDAVPSGQALLLSTGGADDYLVTQNRAFPVATSLLTPLRLITEAPVRVSPQFVAALPQGERLTPVTVSGTGGAGPTIPGHGASKIGQVFVDNHTADIHYLVTAAGLVQLTDLQATLQLTLPATQAANGRSSAIPIDSTPLGQVSSLPDRPAADQRAPDKIPTLLAPGTSEQLCVHYANSAVGTIVYGRQPPDAPGAATAGLVRLGTGQGALAAALNSAGQAAGPTYLITDTGQKFVLKDTQTLTTLGLGNAPIAKLPGAVIDEIPGTVVLDPSAALQVAGAGAAPSSSAATGR